jgi:hypothetical protein
MLTHGTPQTTLWFVPLHFSQAVVFSREWFSLPLGTCSYWFLRLKRVPGVVATETTDFLCSCGNKWSPWVVTEERNRDTHQSVQWEVSFRKFSDTVRLWNFRNVPRHFRDISPSCWRAVSVIRSRIFVRNLPLNQLGIENFTSSETGSLWRRQSRQSFNTLTPFNFLFYSLHVSAPTGHPQVRYTISYYFCFKDYFYTKDPCHVCNLFIGLLFVVIGISTCSPNTCYHIKYKK